MSETFFTSDTHFRHKRVVIHNQTPWKTVDEWDEGIIANINSVVGKKDDLWMLGDYAFDDHAKIFHRLNGKKHLVAGSHDDMPREVLKNFSNFQNSIEEMRNVMLKINGKRYFLSHTCHRTWEACHYGVPHLFGHSHGRCETFNMSFEVSLFTKLANFKPIHLSVIDAEVERRRQMMEDTGRTVMEYRGGRPDCADCGGTGKYLRERIDPLSGYSRNIEVRCNCKPGVKLYRQDDVYYFRRLMRDESLFSFIRRKLGFGKNKYGEKLIDIEARKEGLHE